MGFGLILFGILFLTGVEAGFGVAGYILIFAGCLKLSRIHRDFLACGILSLCNLPYTVLSALTMFNVLEAGNVYVSIFNVAHYVFTASMCLIFCLRIREIAKAGDDQSFGITAMRNGLFAVMYFVWEYALLFIPLIRNTVVVGILVLFRYILIALGVWFMISCGAKITTEKQMEKELALASRKLSKEKKK